MTTSEEVAVANPAHFEQTYQKYIADLSHWIPDGLQEIDIGVLEELNLLQEENPTKQGAGDLTRFFHVIESIDKITLFNDKFVIWIVPQMMGNQPQTHTLIALNREEEEPKLEMGFSTSGVYNTSKMVLRILEKFLIEIQENEELMRSLG